MNDEQDNEVIVESDDDPDSDTDEEDLKEVIKIEDDPDCES